MRELPSSVRGLLDESERIFVVAPPLPSRIEWLASDTDRAQHEADERLGRILDQLGSAHGHAEGSPLARR